MQRSTAPKIARTVFACFCLCTYVAAAAQTTMPSEGSTSFEEYFKLLTAERNFDKSFPKFEALVQSTQTMTTAELVQGLAVIDRKIDAEPSEPNDYYLKNQAVFLLGYIGARPDISELIATQMGRLASMLIDPSHRFTPPAFHALQLIGYRYPQLVIPILEDALENPEANNKTGPGSGVSALLLRLAPRDQDAAARVVLYMHRPDMTDEHLLDTIVGIDSGPIPDAVAAELVRCLDRPNDLIKSHALIGISKSSPAAKEAAKSRIELMASDAHETAHIKHLAQIALAGKIAGNPNADQQDK